MTITISFACNHSNGCFSGRFSAIEFAGPDGDMEAELSGPSRALKFLHDRIHVSGMPYKASRRRCHVGNLIWDSVRMDLNEARRLLAVLVGYGWTIDGGAVEGPLADMVIQ